LKALYGLTQAARQWWKKFKEVMKTIDYSPSPVDPCLFINTSTVKHSFVINYVDDGGIFSTKDNIDKLIQALNKDFKVKYLGAFGHYVGCHVIENRNRDTIWTPQPKLIKHLKEKLQ
jgi:Reverse transcriptase (RNA-dependent DNA polymerase)